MIPTHNPCTHTHNTHTQHTTHTQYAHAICSHNTHTHTHTHAQHMQHTHAQHMQHTHTHTHTHNTCKHTHMHNTHIHTFRYQQYVGHVSYVTFDQSVQGSKRLLVASESGALAAVNTRTGNISKKFLYCGCVHILYTDVTKERGVL